MVSPTPTPSITATSVVRRECLTVETALPPGFTVSGSLILSGYHDTRYEEYLLDLESREKLVLPTAIHSFISLTGVNAVSPDRKWYAYEEYFYDEPGKYQGHQLRIVTADGQQLSLPDGQIQTEWGNIVGWVDNERLALTVAHKFNGSVIVLNPFTGQAQELAPAFPRIQNVDHIYWYGRGDDPFVIYDPTLTRVAYLKYSGGDSYVLWDVETQKVLWERKTHDASTMPIWSPDATQIAMAIGIEKGRTDLFLVNREGQETRLTDLAAAYPFPITLAGYFTWSPDGRYLAFWVQVRSEWESRGIATLAVIDVQTKQVVDYCIPGNPWSDPLWSADGHYLIVEGNVEDTTRAVFLDIGKAQAFEVVKDVYVWGWLAAP